MEIRQLQTFLMVVKYMNFTKAAEALGYAQSTVTTQIKNLELFLDTHLFERIGKSIYLTEMGQGLIPKAKAITDLYEETEMFFRHQDKVQGLVRIATPESLCIKWFPKVYRALGESYEEVSLDLKIYEAEAYQDLLKHNEVDMAFVIHKEGDLIPSDFDIIDRRRVDMHVIASIDHPIMKKQAVASHGLDHQRLILTQEQCCYRKEMVETIERQHIQPKEVLSIGNMQVIKDLVQSGYGIGYLPVFAIEDELNQGKLKAVEGLMPDVPFYMSVLLHKDKWSSPAMTVFGQVLKEIRL